MLAIAPGTLQLQLSGPLISLLDCLDFDWRPPLCTLLAHRLPGMAILQG